MLLDLDKWNPFRFSRPSPERAREVEQGRAQPTDRHRNDKQASSSATPTNTAVSTSQERPRWPLPDPLHLFTDLIRDPFGAHGPLGNWFGDFSPSQFQPRVDVIDDGDALRIVAELPGLARDDVELEVVEDMLVLSGEKGVESESKEQGCYRVERTFGHFQRAIPLPSGIDLERAESKFDNGVLTVRIPKAPEQATANRRLEIK
jgi:HSP20 family protein